MGSFSSPVIFELSSEFVSEVCWGVQLTSAASSIWHFLMVSQCSLGGAREDLCHDAGGAPCLSRPGPHW